MAAEEVAVRPAVLLATVFESLFSSTPNFEEKLAKPSEKRATIEEIGPDEDTAAGVSFVSVVCS